MHRASIFFMTALIAHYSTKALVNYRARLSSLSLRGQISQKFSVLAEKDTPIEPVDIIALQSEVTRSYHELWVLQFDGGSRGNNFFLSFMTPPISVDGCSCQRNETHLSTIHSAYNIVRLCS